MEKGFRTIRCPGCFVKLRFPISEKDYGTTRTIRCPKCGTQGRVEIPKPAPEFPFSVPRNPDSSFSNPFDQFFSPDTKDLLDMLAKGKKP